MSNTPNSGTTELTTPPEITAISTAPVRVATMRRPELERPGEDRTPCPMSICMLGAGAVGSHFAVRLALSGHDVSCVMRGPHLEAVKANGLTLRVGDAEFSARVQASDDPATLGPQDLVISTLKANSLGSLVTGLPPLLRENTGIV